MLRDVIPAPDAEGHNAMSVDQSFGLAPVPSRRRQIAQIGGGWGRVFRFCADAPHVATGAGGEGCRRFLRPPPQQRQAPAFVYLPPVPFLSMRSSAVTSAS